MKVKRPSGGKPLRFKGRYFDKALPEGFARYFENDAHKPLYKKYGAVYVLSVLLAMVALFAPVVLFFIFACPESSSGFVEILFVLAGLVGSLSIGIGLCNLIALVIDQYLGHRVTWIALGGGIILTALSCAVLLRGE